MAAVIEVLQGRLNKNSSNSSKPPSSDGLKKTNSLHQPSGNKPGGQVGHPGSTLEQTATPHTIIKHPLPEQCDVCSARLDATGAQLLKAGQVFDIPLPKLQVTEHQAYALQCQCGKRHESALPQGICEVTQYGPNVRDLGCICCTAKCCRMGVPANCCTICMACGHQAPHWCCAVNKLLRW